MLRLLEYTRPPLLEAVEASQSSENNSNRAGPGETILNLTAVENKTPIESCVLLAAPCHGSIGRVRAAHRERSCRVSGKPGIARRTLPTEIDQRRVDSSYPESLGQIRMAVPEPMSAF
jgi:hypothetical protein